MLLAESMGSLESLPGQQTRVFIQIGNGSGKGGKRGTVHIKAHDTSPHMPPAVTTASLLLLGLSPAIVVPTCLPLS